MQLHLRNGAISIGIHCHKCILQISSLLRRKSRRSLANSCSLWIHTIMTKLLTNRQSLPARLPLIIGHNRWPIPLAVLVLLKEPILLPEVPLLLSSPCRHSSGIQVRLTRELLLLLRLRSYHADFL